jgi:hypothetical protein
MQLINHRKIIFVVIGLIVVFTSSLTFSVNIQNVNAATQCVDPDGPNGPKPNCCVSCLNSQCTRIYNADTCTTACLAPNVCSGGTTTCGTCPSGGGSCTPGQWGGCGSNGCGSGQTSQCNGSGTGWNCFNDPASCSGGGGGTCTPSNPTAAVLTGPADNATLYSTSVTFTWNLNGGYGNGCPNSNRVRVYTKAPNPDGTCTGGGFTQLSNQAATATSFTYNSLVSGNSYCWLVQKTNGTNATNSLRRKFRVVGGPTINSSGIASGQVCTTGNAIGIFDSNPATRRTSNPVTFNVSATNTSTDTLYGVFIGFVPRTVDDNTLNSYGIVTGEAEQYGAGILYNYETSSISVRSGGAWNPTAVNGDLTSPNGRITVLGVNSNSLTTVAGANISSNFQLQFNNIAQGADIEWNNEYNLYISVLMRAADTSIYSNDPTASFPTRSRKSGTFIIDTVAPTAQIQSVLNTQTSFSADWQGSDSRPLKNVSSYIFTLSGNSYAIDRFAPGGGSLGAILVSPNTELTIADAPNGGATIANYSSGTFTYSSGASSDLDELNLRIYSEDQACNISSATQKLGVPDPWIMSLDNTISGGTGIQDFTIPDKSISLQEVGFTGSAIFSDDFVIGGSGSFLEEKISNMNTFVSNYLNQATSTLPIGGSSGEGWYEYLIDLAERNGKTQINTLSQDTISGNLSSSLSGVQDGKRIWIVNPTSGTVSIQKNAVCNVQGLIFINGNLNLDTDFTTSNANNGCMFVVKGNLTITEGDRKTNLPVSSDTNANYDKVQGQFFVDGTLALPVDDFATNEKWDGLQIEGGIYAKNLDFHRDLNLNANLNQPALLIKFDPKYRELFRLDLAQREYSLREVRD